MFGYAECRNAGKSKANEDMCAFHVGRFGCHTPYYMWVRAYCKKIDARMCTWL